MAIGYQDNNFSPMGQGQTDRGKTGKRKPNFMQQVGLGDNPLENIAPGIPTSNTMPVGQNPIRVQPTTQMPNVPTSFQGSGTGWRGLDVTPVNNPGANNFSGFNLQRAFGGGDPNSTKDAFARWASGFGQNLGSLDKNAGGALEQQLRSRLDDARKMGLNIQDIKGDKILIDAKENPGQFNWVDIMQNAGANGSFAWQPENVPGTAPANQIYQSYQNQLQSQDPSTDLEELLIALMSQNEELI